MTVVIFFTTIQYETPYHIITQQLQPLSKEHEVLLVCGIANPQPLTDYIHEATKTYDALFYGDHHIYTLENLLEIEERLMQIKDEKKIIVTTEKDAVRLIKFSDRVADLPLYVLPIAVQFLFGQEDEFKSLIASYPEQFYKQQQLDILNELVNAE